MLPEILSPEEVAAIFDACHNLKHKTLLMTSYSGGLRLGETLGLLPERHRQHADDDPDRAGQGTQGPLRDAVRDAPRGRCAPTGRPSAPSGGSSRDKTKGQPLSPSTAEKVFTTAAGRAGITKGRLVPLAAPRLRDPPPRRRHQHPRDPGPARSPEPDHDPGLHPRGPHLRERHREPARPAERRRRRSRTRSRPWHPRPSSPRSPAATRSPTSYATTRTACA